MQSYHYYSSLYSDSLVNHKTKVKASFKCRVRYVDVYLESFETWLLQVMNKAIAIVLYRSCAVTTRFYSGKVKLLKQIEPVRLRVRFPVHSTF